MSKKNGKIRKCLICSKEFYAKAVKIKQGLAKYCSKGCFYISHKGMKLSKKSRKKMSVSHLANPTRYWLGKKRSATSGEKHHNWKNGRRIDAHGYVLILCSTHPFRNVMNCVFEHRLIMETYLGRYLIKKEVVHHINGIPNDNRIENLMLFPNQRAHFAFHQKNNMPRT
jgi:hypothetical protein